MSSPILAVLDHYEPNRVKTLDWWRWLCMNYVDGIPESISGEELGEVVPPEIRDEVELYFEKSATEQIQ